MRLFKQGANKKTVQIRDTGCIPDTALQLQPTLKRHKLCAFFLTRPHLGGRFILYRCPRSPWAVKSLLNACIDPIKDT